MGSFNNNTWWTLVPPRNQACGFPSQPAILIKPIPGIYTIIRMEGMNGVIEECYNTYDSEELDA